MDIIQDLTCTGPDTRPTLTATTLFSAALPCDLGYVARDVRMHRVAGRLMLCRVHVERKYRKVLVDPEGALAFVLWSKIINTINLSLKFDHDWPDIRGFISAALENAHTRNTSRAAEMLDQSRVLLPLRVLSWRCLEMLYHCLVIVGPSFGRVAVASKFFCIILSTMGFWPNFEFAFVDSRRRHSIACI